MTAANETQVGGDHYKKGGSHQHWDFISVSYGSGYLVGCATKYLTRWRDKNGIEDLKKAVHYCQKLREMAEDTTVGPRPASVPFRMSLEDFVASNNIPPAEAAAIQLIFTWRTAADIAQAEAIIADLIEAELRG